MGKLYTVNEVFYSLQGEGKRAGTANVFVRFTGCNMRCDIEPGDKSPGGFACDTEFTSGRRVTFEELLDWIRVTNNECNAVILTGGEPGLQVDDDLVDGLQSEGFYVAIETNGTTEVPDTLDWITVSPKVAEHAIKQRVANEVKYVRGYGMELPDTVVEARDGGESMYHKLVSPAFDGGHLDEQTLKWCIDLVKRSPDWELSTQQHNLWRVR